MYRVCVYQSGGVFILNSFLGTDNLFYGFHILKDLLNGREWEVSGNFPRVTMCDFEHMKFIRKYLRATDLATDRQSVKKFVHKFLGFDGVFCMRMISAHAGDIMATELIVALWHNFNDRVRKVHIFVVQIKMSSSMNAALRYPKFASIIPEIGEEASRLCLVVFAH
ncbi:Innexin [Oesophagostomum dentatum]|uniref:Innexin n=1 Tax=Oesophagostomum dentatum TaxID=61180 RepID=A0A0B1SNC0_OESDE|nr:Innexin [Oesophagostomum dentatum]